MGLEGLLFSYRPLPWLLNAAISRGLRKLWKRITCSVVSGVRVRARARVRVRVRVRVRAIFRGSGWGELHRRVRRDLLGLQLGEVGEHAREGRVHLAGCEGGGVVFGPRAAAAIPPRCQFDLVAAPRALHRHEGLVGLALAVARPREALRALGPHVDGRRLPRRQSLLLLLRRRSYGFGAGAGAGEG